MNKQITLLLLGLLAAVLLVSAENKLTDELGEEDLSPDGGLGGLNEIFGTTNVLEAGVGKLVDDYKGPCYDKKNNHDCKICCHDIGKAHKWASYKVAFHKCICFNTSPVPK